MRAYLRSIAGMFIAIPSLGLGVGSRDSGRRYRCNLVNR